MHNSIEKARAGLGVRRRRGPGRHSPPPPRLRGGTLARLLATAALATTLLAGCGHLTPSATNTGVTDYVSVTPADHVTTLVASSLPATGFVFAPGTYHLSQPIVPRDGDTFTANGHVVLTGAIALDGFAKQGAYWVAHVTNISLGYTPQPGARCRPTAPRCDDRQDLFVNDQPLAEVGSLSTLTDASQWFLDYGSQLVYLTFDPSGKTVELSSTEAAFYGDASNVTIEGFTIEKFASMAQHGAIQAGTAFTIRNGSDGPYVESTRGHHWTIRNNEFRFNHGAAIHVGPGAVVNGNYIHDQGQIGLLVTSGSGAVVSNNEIANNNYAGYSDDFEDGGAKFTDTVDLTVRDNNVHDNKGPGLWTDTDNQGTLYDHNTVTNNTGPGIYHEISYSAEIRNNDIEGNGANAGVQQYAYVGGSGILISNSTDVYVHDNTVKDNWNGINAVWLDRSASKPLIGDAYTLDNIRVVHNVISLSYHANGISWDGSLGVPSLDGVSEVNCPKVNGVPFVFTPAAAITFQNNTYVGGNATVPHFAWDDVWLTLSAWVAQGFG